MARQSIAITVAKKSVDPAFVAPTLTNSNDTDNHDWTFDAGDMLIVFNTGAGAHNITLIASADAQGRTTNSSQSLGANKMAVFGPLKALGWLQGDKIHVDTDDGATEMKWCVIRGVTT